MKVRDIENQYLYERVGDKATQTMEADEKNI